jgi:hypothetical protein
MFSEAFGGASSIEAWVDQSSVGFKMQVVCELQGDGEAKQAAALVEVARVAISEQETRVAAVARHASVQAEGRHVLVRVDLPLAVFGEMLGGAFE